MHSWYATLILIISSTACMAENGFWSPSTPPRAHYAIDCRMGKAGLDGKETIRLRNSSTKPITRLAVAWAGEDPVITVRGKRVVMGKRQVTQFGEDAIPFQSFDLPEALSPGREVELGVEFHTGGYGDITGRMHWTGWYPRLWWGYGTHDDYDVKVEIPDGFALATSGRLNEKTGRYHAEGVRQFGLVLGKGYGVLEASAGDVLVRCMYGPDGAEAARHILENAVDAIGFYREWLGFYPYKSLDIVPGDDEYSGGWNVATSISAIHQLSKLKDKASSRWITAHEIGHMYWGEYVMDKDAPDWMWIGLGLRADREYSLARGFMTREEYLKNRSDGYIRDAKTGADTTLERPTHLLLDLQPNWYNNLRHSKGYCVVSALESVLGEETFERAYKRCLREFGGRCMGAHEFQAVCEAESGQDLDWFFEQWVRSDRCLSYRIASQDCAGKDGKYVSKIEVKRLGALRMPVPVEASFEDGTHQVKLTDRLLDTDTLTFESKSRLKDARLDPDSLLAMVIPPPPDKAEFYAKMNALPYTGQSKEAQELLAVARVADIKDNDVWLHLGLALYDDRQYGDALDAFERISRAGDSDARYRFVSLVWQGHILDLLDRRDDALAKYNEALKLDVGDNYRMKHDQYRLIITRQWAKERLSTPFQRK